jgi:superfamily II DNA or RNA helicase
LTNFEIKAIILKYPDEIRKQLRNADYQTELDFLVRNDARNRFIVNLTLSLRGNTLLMFQFVEKHGKVLYELLKDCGREVYFVHGGVDGEDREQIRKLLETEKEAIVVASVGTFSTGVNIPSLRNIISASPSKSKIRNLQSIGRVLRKSADKDGATLYDIADDLTWKSKKNFTIMHFVERMKIYNEEKFDYKIYPVNLKDA